MKKNSLLLGVVRWSGRVLGILSICTILLFVFGEKGTTTNIALKEWIGFLFFPIGIFIGILIAWRNEIAGGVVCIASLVCFYFIYSLLLNGHFPQGMAFLVISIPGFISLLSGVLHKQLK